MKSNIKGPFYVRDKDFVDREVYIPAPFCKDCAFFDDSDGGWCPMSPCLHFEFTTSEEETENGNGKQ